MSRKSQAFRQAQSAAFSCDLSGYAAAWQGSTKQLLVMSCWSAIMLRVFADLGFRWKIALPILLVAMGGRGITQVAESSTTLTNRHLPAVSLLLNADGDLY